jgi:DNA-binding IclR family transcriptional regulator
MAQPAKPKITSLERALDLLELLSERDEVKLAELPKLLGASRATGFRLLATLQERGYVVHNKAARSYSLGAAAASLGSRSRAAGLLDAAEAELQRLRDATSETANLAILQGSRLTYLRILDGRHSLRMSGVVGEDAPIHATALGKAVLAALPDEQHAALVGQEPFEAYTERTPTSLDALRPEVARARELGYAIDDEAVDSGAVCLGAAIRLPGGEPVGGLSVSGAAARLGEGARAEFGEATAAAARRVGEALRWR